MSPHVSAGALEALAHSRLDLATDEERRHVAECAQCTRAVADTAALSRVAGTTLRRVDLPSIDLEAIVSAAMSAGPAPTVAVEPSRRSLLVASVMAVAAACALGLASRKSLPRASSVLDATRDAWTVVSALGHFVFDGSVPGLPAILAFGALAAFALFAFSTRVIAAGAVRALGAGGVQ